MRWSFCGYTAFCYVGYKKAPSLMLLLGEAVYWSIYKHFAPDIPKNYCLSLRTCSMSKVIWLYVGGIKSHRFWGSLGYGFLSPCEVAEQESNISHVVCSWSYFAAEDKRSFQLKISSLQNSVKCIHHVTVEICGTGRLFQNEWPEKKA
jgi:hypothetical protein